MVISRELMIEPDDALDWLTEQWKCHWGILMRNRSFYVSDYLADLDTDPLQVAACLRELAEDPEVLAHLTKMVKEKTDD